MEIRLTVTAEHCIVTAVRQAHDDFMRRFFRTGDAAALEACEMLACFAATEDLPALRRLSEARMRPGAGAVFVLRGEPGGTVSWRLENDQFRHRP